MSEYKSRNNDAGLPGGGMPDFGKFQIGKPQELPAGNQDLTPQFGQKKELPENLMSNLDSDRLGPDEGHEQRIGNEIKNEVNNEEPNGSEFDAAIANRFFRTGESLSLEQVGGAEDPQELFEGLRSILRRQEDGNVPGSLEDRYGVVRIFGMMQERADLLKITPDEMLKKGWLKSYDEKTGLGIPKKRKYIALALSSEEDLITVDDKRGFSRQVEVVKYNFGTPEKRKEMEGAYGRAITEIEARTIMNDQVGIRLNPELRDGLESLVVVLRGGRTPKFKADHLMSIFNLPDVVDLAENPKSRKLGDQIEEAMFLNLVMLNCGTKRQTTELLERPGSKYLISKMAKEKAEREGITYTYDQWIKDNIGDYENWVDDKNRNLDTYLTEKRGPLTRRTNIAADDKDAGLDEELEFIEGTVGNLVGSIEASWIAATMMRVIGAYASEGYVALPNGTFSLALGQDGYISGDDTGKFYAYMQSVKEGIKGRNSFLAGMIGKVPDLAMNLFDWTQVKVETPGGKFIRRSIWDAWLGTAGNKDILDVLTMKPTGEKTIEEPYHRLGDLDFKSLPRDFHGKFATMQWLTGSGDKPVGIVNEAWTTDVKPDDFRLVALKKIRKYVGIVMNPVILTKGSMHRFDTSKFKIVQRNYLRNLMLARIHSASFTLNVLPSAKALFNPQPSGKTDLPDPILIRENIKEILKNFPTNENELLQHYIDENKKMREMADLKNPKNAIDELLGEKFEPEDPREKELMNYVGPVKGRKVMN